MRAIIKKYRPLIILFVVISILFTISIVNEYNYTKNLSMGWGILYTLSGQFFTSHILAVFFAGVATFILWAYHWDYKDRPHHQKTRERLLCFITPLPCIVLVLYLFYVQPDYFKYYKVNGESRTFLELLVAEGKDYIEQEYETITFDTYEWEAKRIRTSGRLGSSTTTSFHFLNINHGEYVLPVPRAYYRDVGNILEATIGEHICDRENICHKYGIKVYKNTKLIIEVQGYPLTELSKSVVDAYKKRELSMQCDLRLDQNGFLEVVCNNSELDISELSMTYYEEDGSTMADIMLSGQKLTLGYGTRYDRDQTCQVCVTGRLGVQVSNRIQYDIRNGNIENIRYIER